MFSSLASIPPFLQIVTAMNCPSCSGQMLQHIRKRELYWLCPDCRQEMPIADRRLLFSKSAQPLELNPQINIPA
jgi:uncharacterized protein YbaR (Trm112 family)